MIRDTRTILVEFKDNACALGELASALSRAEEDGYELIHAETRSHGQRDPIVTGLQLTLRKEIS